MTQMTEDEYRLLSLMLARHVDDLQGVASTWGERFVDEYSSTQGDVALLAEEYVRFSSGRDTLSYAAVRKRDKLRERIYELRSVGLNESMAYLQERLAELVKTENQFGGKWLIAMYGLAYGLPEDEVNARFKPKPLTETQMDSVRKYGTYNGNTVDGIFQKVFESDVDRIMSAIDHGINANLAQEKKPGVYDGIIQMVNKAALTTSKQIMLNVAMVVNGISNNVSVEIAKRNIEIAGMVMWITEMDERVCEDCDALEGMTFTPDEAPACPMHPNCRCHLIPVTQEIADDITDRRKL